ncbi:Large T antigen [Grifec polyomavirus GB3]|nr:Large T antigen [Grifec polyomavirus GB3]
MDKILNLAEKNELMDLLGLDRGSWGDLNAMQQSYRQKCRIFHPDKGGDGEKMKRLTSLFQTAMDNLTSTRTGRKTMENTPPTYGTEEWDSWWEDFNRNWDNLSCDETLDASDEERTPPKKKRKTTEEDFQHSQSTPPKGQNSYPSNLPECLFPFISTAVYSNRTYSSFIVYTTREKGCILYFKLMQKFKAMFSSEHSYKNESLVLILCSGKHRVSAVYNYCKLNCTVSFVVVKALTKPYEAYYFMCKGDFKMLQQSREEGLKLEEFSSEDTKEKQLDWKQLCSFAVGIQCEDPLLVMGYYINFSESPVTCKKCLAQDKVHVKYHMDHHDNAKLFVISKSQKNSCQQACDWVMAQNRLLTRTASREEIMVARFKELFKRMEDIHGEIAILEYMAGVAWLSLVHEHFDELLVSIIRLIVENTPKFRNVLFIGPYNSGKTTVAAAINDMFKGVTLNINCASEKLSFEVGCAIDKFVCVFEDVKGTSKSDLFSGPGITNLDNMRDFLDGAVPVNLEKKHCNKHSQIFPPAIVTMNNYNLPLSLEIRFAKKVVFTHKPYLKKALEKNSELVKKRILQNGITLLFLLIWWQPLAAFHSDIQADVKLWRETISRYCSMMDFNKMCQNIQNGMDPLQELLEEDSDPEEKEQASQEDSGVENSCTQ